MSAGLTARDSYSTVRRDGCWETMRCCILEALTRLVVLLFFWRTRFRIKYNLYWTAKFFEALFSFISILFCFHYYFLFLMQVDLFNECTLFISTSPLRSLHTNYWVQYYDTTQNISCIISSNRAPSLVKIWVACLAVEAVVSMSISVAQNFRQQLYQYACSYLKSLRDKKTRSVHLQNVQQL